MTEDEAKAKSCPLLFMGNIATLLAHDREQVQYKCVGSACMMWRCEPKQYERNAESHNPDCQPEGDGWVWRTDLITVGTWSTSEPGWYRESADRGYCGLAGKP